MTHVHISVRRIQAIPHSLQHSFCQEVCKRKSSLFWFPSTVSVILPNHFLWIQRQEFSAKLPEYASISLTNDHRCVKHIWGTFPYRTRWMAKYSILVCSRRHTLLLFVFLLSERSLSLSKHSATLDGAQTAKRAPHLFLHFDIDGGITIYPVQSHKKKKKLVTSYGERRRKQ